MWVWGLYAFVRCVWGVTSISERITAVPWALNLLVPHGQPGDRHPCKGRHAESCRWRAFLPRKDKPAAETRHGDGHLGCLLANYFLGSILQCFSNSRIWLNDSIQNFQPLLSCQRRGLAAILYRVLTEGGLPSAGIQEAVADQMQQSHSHQTPHRRTSAWEEAPGLWVNLGHVWDVGVGRVGKNESIILRSCFYL